MDISRPIIHDGSLVSSNYSPGDRQELTQSMWRAYGQCPHRFKLNYIDRIVRTTSAMPLVFGSLIHEMVQREFIHEDSAPILADWISKIEQAIDDGTASFDAETLSKHVQLAHSMVQRWKSSPRDFDVLEIDGKPLIEAHARTQISDSYDFANSFDGIVVRGSEIWVWELKTSAISSADEYQRKIQHDPQAWGYVWQCRQLFGRCDGIVYDVIRKRIPPEVKLLTCRKKDHVGCDCDGTLIKGISTSVKDTTIDRWEDAVERASESTYGRAQLASGELDDLEAKIRQYAKSYPYRIWQRPDELFLSSFEDEIKQLAAELDGRTNYPKMRGNCRLFNRDCSYLPMCPTLGDVSKLFTTKDGDRPIELQREN